MERWITRGAAALCAAGSIALFWTFGAFLAVPWHTGRLFALTPPELQVLGVALLGGVAVAWGALHVLAIADREARPVVYRSLCGALIVSSLLAVCAGIAWTTERFA